MQESKKVYTSEKAGTMPELDLGLDPVQWRNVDGVQLSALKSYWVADVETKLKCVNGAGPDWILHHIPKWMVIGRFFANHMYGLDIEECCNIHDWDYLNEELTEDGRLDSDNRLRENLYRTIRARESGKIFTWLRINNARRYYVLVRAYGSKAYFNR
jgi:hypothetical protein